MRKLILIRHSEVEVRTECPARQWRLSERGRGLCDALADELAPHSPAIFVSSAEEKASETASLLANRLNRPMEIVADLHEHRRENVPFMEREQFLELVQEFFDRPDRLVFGSESANQAGARFGRAVDDALARHPAGNLVIVSHGTVMSLFVAQRAGIAAYDFWNSLRLPDFVVMTIPDFQILKRAHRLN